MKKIFKPIAFLSIGISLLATLCACSNTAPQNPCYNGHTYGEETVIRNATCSQEGMTSSECTACSDTVHNYSNKIDQIYENGFCTMCQKYEDEYMKFQLNDDGESYKVSEYSDNSRTEVTVPATFQGKPVTVIGGQAFANTQNLIRINLPDTIVELGGGAFSGCTSLEAPILPESLRVIKNHAFYGCKFETVELPRGLTELGNAFQNCSNLKSLTIPAGVTVIPDEAFWLCPALESVTMLGEAERIGVKAFKDCKKLVRFSAKGTPAIEEQAFNSCGELRIFDVPEGVSKLGRSAFAGCMRMYSITLAENLTEIGSAFGNDQPLSMGAPRLAQIINYSSLELMPKDKTSHGGITRYARNTAINFDRGDVIPSKIEYINDFVVMVETGTSTDGNTVCKWFTVIDYVGNAYAPEFPDLVSDEYEIMEYTVAAYAFYKNSTIMLADMPEGITCIEDNAFADCSRLLRLDIPSTVEYVSYSIGYGNIAEVINRTKTDLTSIKNVCSHLLYLNQELDPILNPENNFDSLIKNVNGFLIMDYREHVNDLLDRYVLAYVGDSDILTVPERPTDTGDLKYGEYVIRRYAFANSDCSEAVIPNGVTRIDEYAFMGVTLASLSIPDSVTYIGDSAFVSSRIEQFTIPETTRVNCILGTGGSGFDSEGIRYVGSILIDANVPASDDDTVIKDGTVRIGDRAFSNERLMTKLTVANGVKYIGSRAFDGCSSLTVIILPESLEEISNYIIADCTSLEKIVFGGTVDEWLALIENVQLCGNMGRYIEYTVECRDGTITMHKDTPAQ